MEDWQGPLWDAINRYVAACGGDPSKHVYGNTTRQRAVADVNHIFRDAVLLEAADRLARIGVKENK